METDSNVVFTQDQGNGVFLLTINRPERRNALNLAVKSRLVEQLAVLEQDRAVRVVIITGAEGSFVAGTDIEEMKSMTPTDHTLLATDAMFTAIRRFTKPLIAAVERFALGGGCELALSCDLIIAGRGARFGLPEVRVGVMPGAGGTQRLLRTIGKYRTMLMVMTGEHVLAADGYTMGFVSALTDDGQALNRATELALVIAEMPPLAIRAIKEVVQVGGDAPLETALLLERKAFQLLYDTKDQTEGMQAFLDKRKPSFTGK